MSFRTNGHWFGIWTSTYIPILPAILDDHYGYRVSTQRASFISRVSTVGWFHFALRWEVGNSLVFSCLLTFCEALGLSQATCFNHSWTVGNIALEPIYMGPWFLVGDWLDLLKNVSIQKRVLVIEDIEALAVGLASCLACSAVLFWAHVVPNGPCWAYVEPMLCLCCRFVPCWAILIPKKQHSILEQKSAAQAIAH